MQLTLKLGVLSLLGVGLVAASAPSCNLCDIECPAGQKCITYDAAGILDNNLVQDFIAAEGLPVPTVPAGTTVKVSTLS